MLRGEQKVTFDDGRRARHARVSINIAPEVRARLRALLFEPDMRGVGYSEFISRALDAAEAEKTASVPCEAKLYHGPGHQSGTRCELTGPHEVHKCHYGEFNQYASWREDMAMTGFFDEPPDEED